MNNIQTDIILEFQKSIENMTRFGQEMELLDSRFGRLDQRVDALRASMGSLNSTVSRGAGSNLRQKLQQELNDIVAGNGVLVRTIGNSPLQITRETVKDLFNKVETELNKELHKYVRNLTIDIDPSYAGGQRLPIGNEEFNEINKEVARVIKLQVRNLVSAIQKHKHNLISPETLQGLDLTISKATVQALVNKIKKEVITKINNPNIEGVDAELKITRNDLQRVVNQVKSKLKEAFNVDVADVKSLDAADINNKVKRIPEEIDQRLREYVNKTVAGINNAMQGRMEVPIKDLNKTLKRSIARELNVSIEQLEQQLQTIDIGSIRMYEAKTQLERVTKALDRKIGRGLQKEIDSVVKRIEEVEISYSPKLKRHLISQINRVNNRIVEKIREQIDIQVSHMLQEISEVQARPRNINRDRMLREAGKVEGGTQTRREVISTGSEKLIHQRPVVNYGSDPYARRDAHFNSFGLQGAMVNTLRHILAGSIVSAPIMAVYKAMEAFKISQQEQIKMFQNLILKEPYKEKDSQGNNTGNLLYGKLESSLSDIQSYIRQQSSFYGINYGEMYQVGGVASRLLDTPAEIKRFVQYTGQLKTLDPQSDVMAIANGLEAVKAQFRLEIGELENAIVRPLVAVSNVTNATVEDLLEALKRSGSTFEVGNIDPMIATVLSGVSIQATGLEGANIGNFYKSILTRLQSDANNQLLGKLGVQQYEIDPMTGARNRREGDAIFTDLAEALTLKDDKSRRDIYTSLFGLFQTSKGSATMTEITENFVKVKKAMEEFDMNQFMEMLRKSIQNPYVNIERVQSSFSVTLDTLMQQLTPAINKAAYSLINMSDAVARNADLFVQLGGVISNVILGSLLMKGIKWGIGKTGIAENTEIQRQRTSYVGGVGNLVNDAGLRHLFADGALSVGDKGLRRQAAGIQKDPILSQYLREFNAMNAEQVSHLKNYLEDSKITVKDLPTLFSAMEEAKGWEQRKVLTDSERFDRHKVYNNRLSTNAALANVIDPSFMNTLNNSTSNRSAYSSHMTNALGFRDVSNKMTRMTQTEFDGFEKHLEQMHRNGAPAINSVERLSNAVDDYATSQRTMQEEARKATPAFQNMSHAVRGMNEHISRTDRLRNNFRNFLRDIPNLARGAGMSMLNMGMSIAKMAGHMAVAIGLAEVAKDTLFNMYSTDDQRTLAKADSLDSNEKAYANWLRMNNEDAGVLRTGANVISTAWNSLMNTITSPTRFGLGESKDMNNEMISFYNQKGAGVSDAKELSKYLSSQGISYEDAVREWSESTGRRNDIEKLREEAFIKQYEKTKIKEQEEKELLEKAKKAYEERTKQQTKFPIISEDETKSRISERLTEIKNTNQVETLRSIMTGMRTDSEEYISMRKEQVAQMRQVLNDELAVLDRYISNMVTLMAQNSPDSAEYKEAAKTKESLETTRKKISDETESEVLQEEYNLQQEQYQKQVGKVDRNIQRAELIAQSKELAAALSMDRESESYIEALRQITVNKINSMKTELENLKSVQAMGDQTEELADKVLTTQNALAQENLKLKELNLSRYEVLKNALSENDSERELRYLEARVKLGNPDESSPVLRNLRIAQSRQEIQDIGNLIAKYTKEMNNVPAEEQKRLQQEIRDLQKRSLQAQLGILDELKSGAGTFNLPDGVTAMSRYEWLTAGNTHQSYTVGSGDVLVNITLPNVTNGASQGQLEAIGQGLGKGIMWGKAGGFRNQMLMNPSAYRPRY